MFIFRIFLFFYKVIGDGTGGSTALALHECNLHSRRLIKPGVSDSDRRARAKSVTRVSSISSESYSRSRGALVLQATRVGKELTSSPASLVHLSYFIPLYECLLRALAYWDFLNSSRV